MTTLRQRYPTSRPKYNQNLTLLQRRVPAGYWRDPYKNWFRLKLWTVLKRTIKMFRALLLIVHNEKQQSQDNWCVEWRACKQVMAGECRILVVQGSSTHFPKYNLISLGFLFSSKLIIMKESYVSTIFLIISGSSLRKKFSKTSHSLLVHWNRVFNWSFIVASGNAFWLITNILLLFRAFFS